MSCPNYQYMGNFSLYTLDNIEADEAYFLTREIQQELDVLNRSLLFHKIGIDCGYYYGLQFTVDEEHDPNELDNEDCQYYFDMYRSVAIRRYNSEINKINRLLRRLATMYGFTEMVCTGIFANGEACYAPATHRSRMIAAVRA